MFGHIFLHTSAYVIRQHTSVSFFIRQHTSFREAQNCRDKKTLIFLFAFLLLSGKLGKQSLSSTSYDPLETIWCFPESCVSIRQHTSAYKLGLACLAVSFFIRRNSPDLLGVLRAVRVCCCLLCWRCRVRRVSAPLACGICLLRHVARMCSFLCEDYFVHPGLLD